MSTVQEARVGISEAILVGLGLESGPREGLESRSVEVAPRYIDFLRDTRSLFGKLDLEEISERKLLHLTTSLLQMQDLAKDLNSTLLEMLESGRADIAGQHSLIQRYTEEIAKEMDWFEEKIETLTLALDHTFVVEMNRRIESAPNPSVGTPEWKRELAGLCD
jgi:hypothetical protein